MRFVVELVQAEKGRREDTLEDVHLSLKRLFHISNTALTQIECRLAAEQTRLDLLENRIQACRGKLASNAKLTTYTSLPSLFPTASEDLLADFPSQLSAGHGSEAAEQQGNVAREFTYSNSDPVIPQQALDQLEARIRSEVKHKLALGSQLEASEAVPSAVTVATSVIVAPPEHDLGPAPDSLLRANLLSSSSSLQRTNNNNNSSNSAAAAMAGEDLSFHHQQLQAARATPDSLGLPADLSGVLRNVTKKQEPRPTASPLRQQKATKRPQSLPVLPPQPVAAAVTPVEPAPSLTTPAPRQQQALPIVNLLSEIRERKPLQPAKQQQPAAAVATKPKTLAEEMREKLNRRQAMLSGEGDEEEQRTARKRLGGGMRDNDDARSFISTSTIGPPPPAPARGTALLKLQNNPPSIRAAATANDQVPLMPSFDRVFEREMSKKHLFNQQQRRSDDSDDEEDWEAEQ